MDIAKEFANFLHIAQGSLSELDTQLELTKRLNFVDEATWKGLVTPNSSPKAPLRWLITGGCGFIGTSLIKNIVSEGGHFIRVLDNLSIGTRDDLSSVTNFIEIDSSLLTPNS